MEKPKRCINDLTDDLLIEILVRLPCKSLIKYKSISKRWFALISKPYFSRSFCHHYKTWHYPFKVYDDFFYVSKQVLLITSRPQEVDISVTPSFLPCFQTSQEEEEEEASVVGDSKGLLLCCGTRDNKKIYYVCNPLTKHWVVLPPNPSSQEQQEVRIGFMCYRNNSQGSFKVVLLTEFLGSKSQIKVETFSSVTGQWTKFFVSCPHNIEIKSCGSAVTYKRKLHWFMPSDNKILVYDPVHDKVQAIIDGPKGANPLLGSQCFNVCPEGLRIAQLQNLHTSQCSLSRWTLCNINTGKWCLDHQINLEELTRKNQPVGVNINALPIVNVLGLHPNFGIVYLGLPKHIIACDLGTKKVTIVYEPPYEIPLQSFMHMLPPWPTPVPALPRSKRKADGVEVEDGEVEADMATRRIKSAKKMPVAEAEDGEVEAG